MLRKPLLYDLMHETRYNCKECWLIDGWTKIDNKKNLWTKLAEPYLSNQVLLKNMLIGRLLLRWTQDKTHEKTLTLILFKETSIEETQVLIADSQVLGRQSNEKSFMLNILYELSRLKRWIKRQTHNGNWTMRIKTTQIRGEDAFINQRPVK